MPSKKREVIQVPKKSNFIPVSIILFLVYVGLSLISGIYGLFTTHQTYLGPVFIYSTGTLILLAIYLIIYITIFSGTLMRKRYARTLTLIFYPLIVLISLINLVYYFVNKQAVIDFMMKLNGMTEVSNIIPIESLLLFSFIFSIVIQLIVSGLIVLVMVKKKDFFTN